MRIHDLPYRTSKLPPTLEEARDLEFATREFCRAAVREATLDPALRRDLTAWAVRTQGVGWHLFRNEPFVAVNFAGYLHEAAGTAQGLRPLDALGHPRRLAAEHPDAEGERGGHDAERHQEHRGAPGRLCGRGGRWVDQRVAHLGEDRR